MQHQSQKLNIIRIAPIQELSSLLHRLAIAGGDDGNWKCSSGELEVFFGGPLPASEEQPVLLSLRKRHGRRLDLFGFRMLKNECRASANDRRQQNVSVCDEFHVCSFATP